MIENNKYSVILVPFHAVPPFVVFRYDKKWWKRRVGTLNCALSSNGRNLVMYDEIVIMLKKELNKKDYWQIKYEFASAIKWPRLK